MLGHSKDAAHMVFRALQKDFKRDLINVGLKLPARLEGC
jgi:hypothetical protein